MKKILLTICSIGLLLGPTMAQKTIKDDQAVKRSVKGFHAIQVADGIDLLLTQGGEESVAVSASKEADRDKIITEVVDGVLKIYYERKDKWGISINWDNKKLKAYVAVKVLDELSASGGSDVTFDNTIKSSSLLLKFSGGSDCRGNIQVNDLTIKSSGGSDVNLGGSANSASISVSGGSDVHAYELSTETCVVNASGGSDVKITANKTIETHASGGSDIYYKGNATSKSTSKSGASDVKKVS